MHGAGVGEFRASIGTAHACSQKVQQKRFKWITSSYKQETIKILLQPRIFSFSFD